MTLRKSTFDNSVKCIPKGEQTGDIKPKTIKFGLFPCKQNKNISQINKKIPRNLSTSGFGKIKWIFICQF